MPSPYDDIIEQEAQAWRREIEERSVHQSLYTDRHHPSDPPGSPLVRIDTVEILPSKTIHVRRFLDIEQPFSVPPTTGACCQTDRLHCFIETENNCIGFGGTYQGNGSTCDPQPCCPCCPPFAEFNISGDVTISATAEFIPDWHRTWGNGETLPFTGSLSPGPGSNQYSGGANTDCVCTSEPDCDPFDNCPENFGPDCVYDRCEPPPDVGDPFQYCSGLAIDIRLKCQTTEDGEGSGWYLLISIGSTNLCGGSFAFATDYFGDNYIKITDGCDNIPSGIFSVGLEGYGSPESGSVHVNLTIDELLGACCTGYGTCDELTQLECEGGGGHWFCPGSVCEVTNFAQWGATGACCFAGTCFDDIYPNDCTLVGGTFKGVCTDCAHEIC